MASSGLYTGWARVAKNLGNYRGLFNGGDERQGATIEGTGGHVDLEHPFEQLGPARIG